MTTPMTERTSEGPRSIAVIGAGIGGLSLARALTKSGHDVTVWERSSTLRADGAGITMQINAMTALDAIGVGDSVRAAGAAIEQGALRDASGAVIQALDLCVLSERLGTAGYALHRADLIDILAEGLEPQLQFGRGLVELRHDNSVCELLLSDGARASADIVVGADGIHSATRLALFGEEPLRYAGYTTWRGVTAERPEDSESIGEFWGGDLRFGYLPIGKGKLYWFAVAITEAEGEDGNDPRGELLELFDGWPEAVRSVIGRTESADILRTDTFDRPPSTQWGRGPVTLLGDAAHPMTPNLGQGGGQAVEDAVVLAHFIDSIGAREAALRAYERRRMPRANDFVSRSYSFGKLAHMRPGIGRIARNALMRWVPDSVAHRQLESFYRFELPQRPVLARDGSS